MRVQKLVDDHANDICEALEKNNGYCPCSIKKNKTTKCMCLDFRLKLDDPDWYGKCHCGLYEKVMK